MKASGTYAAIAALTAVTNARNLIRSGPEPTQSFKLPNDGVSPRPTEAAMELFRRAGDFTTLWAPDNTCGYVSGRQGAAYTCNNDYRCALVTSGSVGNVGCCNNDFCNVRYSCVDFEAYWSSSACDDGCAVDAQTLKCTGTTAPYCNTISFADGVTDYWCNNLAISKAQLISTTYSGGDQRKYTANATATTESTTSSEGSSSQTQSTVTVHGSSASSSSDSDNDSDNNNNNNNNDHKKSNVGPIVGGVVGGIGGLALIAGAVWFFLRSKKKKEAAAAAAATTTTTPPAYQPPPMQQQPGTGPGGYNPVPQGQTGYYDPKNPYPQQAQYNTPVVAGYYPGSPDTNQHDPRLSAVNTSPAPTYNQQGFQNPQTVIHEAPTDTSGRNETHELA
ncbi:hypothetical protein BGZ63DRAFT_423508 [Mariannaea sp. PMI_226]|nr:hypothetical protein BGZ63DRAFT_423508 [Mariannaea sp. PMI_226]